MPELLGLLGGLAEGVDAVLELVGGRAVAREDADGRVGRAAEDLAAERRAAVEDLFEVVDGRLADRRVGRDRVGLRPHHGDGRRAQARATLSRLPSRS